MYLRTSFFSLVTILFFGCSDSNSEEELEAQDPIGTMIANISTTTGISFSDEEYNINGSLKWCTPNNLLLETGNLSFPIWVSMCTLGDVKCLSSIKSIPNSGFTKPVNVKQNQIACEPGYGYIIKVSDNSGNSFYVRLYVVEYLVNSTSVIGAKIKYQYPFIP